jgi:hypothetical protein
MTSLGMRAVLLTCLLSLLARAALAEEPIAVQLELPKRLALGKNGYRGKIKVTITNRSDRPMAVHHGEENFLVFEGDGGKLDVICHSCACVQNSAESRAGRGPFTVALAPGGKKELVFADWGCAGSAWRGPLAGTYRVTYRVFLERRRNKPDPRTCCDELRTAEFWKGAISSPPAKLSVVGKRP